MRRVLGLDKKLGVGGSRKGRLRGKEGSRFRVSDLGVAVKGVGVMGHRGQFWKN